MLQCYCPVGSFSVSAILVRVLRIVNGWRSNSLQNGSIAITGSVSCLPFLPGFTEFPSGLAIICRAVSGRHLNVRSEPKQQRQAPAGRLDGDATYCVT